MAQALFQTSSAFLKIQYKITTNPNLTTRFYLWSATFRPYNCLHIYSSDLQTSGDWSSSIFLDFAAANYAWLNITHVQSLKIRR